MERQVSNRYRLIEPLGEGGMGVVWRAYDELLDRTVAIKEVRYTGVGDAKRADLNRRTIREARAAGRLDHPSVIVIHDVVEEDGRPWIVMQLVRSRSLAEVIGERGPLPVPLVAMVGGRVLDALRAAHATGVLHRDVKPENVLLADDGRVVLTDFGIAAMEAEAGLTATGGLVGTPAYMPPERLNGEPARPESDLWSLGATLYAAVEGRPPFKRDSWAATAAAMLRDEPEPPVRAGALQPVIMGLLRRDPAARMPAGEAARLLHQVATGQPLPADQTPMWSAQFPLAPGPSHPTPGGPHPMPGGPYPTPQDSRPVTGGQQVPGHTVPGGPERRRGRTLRIVVPAAVAALALLGGGGVLLYDQLAGATTPTPTADGRTEPPATGQATEPPTQQPTKDPTRQPTEDPSGEPSEEPSGDPSDQPTPTVTAHPVPAGWRTLTSAAGHFSVAVPKSWQAVKTPSRDSIRVSGPGTTGVMIIEWTVPDIPWKDPEQHWIGLEKEIEAKGEFDRYTRIGITPTSYLGLRAADWEFTRMRDGRLIHVINRGFHTAAGRPYALYWETSDARWTADRHWFDTFAKTFRPE
ncbi:serine/threonine-protein kinase [Nonomuraea sp. WAC 01424]|uniref:serine/threonine-protein kinase n=1 Tax=Nonomuraea sp. WAC 01424 TaxID=2203200 RepID=UPI000F773120|nr:serine/threonine-protein kinase [Nonomuraea sp. WAC 01424]